MRLAQTELMSVAVTRTSFCQCCGVRTNPNLVKDLDNWKKFGIIGYFPPKPQTRIDKLAKNREWLVIPDKDGAFVIDWAPEDRKLHDL